MAFNPREFSGMVGGSANAPAIYTYRTEDSLSDISQNDYWNGMGGVFSIGDLVIATVAIGSSPITRSMIVNLSSGVDTKTALMTVFVGDVRNEDALGYQSQNFSGNIGAGAQSRLFTYRNNSEKMLDVTASGYFNELSSILQESDLIYCCFGVEASGDGASYVRVLSNINGVVETEQIKLA